jgi:hypothetical protein
MQPNPHLKLVIPAEDVPLCVGLLAAGLITMIQRGALDSSTGIWTLGAPKFWDPLTGLTSPASELVDVLQSMDEFAAIKRLSPQHFDEALAALLLRLEGLVRRDEIGWTVSWDLERNESRKTEDNPD